MLNGIGVPDYVSIPNKRPYYRLVSIEFVGGTNLSDRLRYAKWDEARFVIFSM